MSNTNWNINDNYISWLTGELYKITYDLGLQSYNFKVYSEQSFAKEMELGPNIINVVLRQLSATKQFSNIVQPIQMTILSEEDSLQAAMIIFSKFFDKNNWNTITDGNVKVKMQHSTPVVLNNFNVVGLGYRSVLYVSTTLYILENVVDLETFEYQGKEHLLLINGEEQDYISFQMSYAMSGNTKPFSGELFAKTVRGVQTLTLSLLIPATSNNFTKDLIDIANGVKNGDYPFNFKFKVTNQFDISLKLVSLTFITAKNDIPAIQLGFMI